MFAVIETGGKQVRVQVGEVVRVERVAGEVGSAVVFDRVLMVGDGDAAQVGRPCVDGAQVKASIVEQGRGKKILVYTFKRRLNSNQKRRGHRQDYTAVKIESIDA
jgi:large subunit ribosomal protein L21